jgi:hypothetical protein
VQHTASFEDIVSLVQQAVTDARLHQSVPYPLIYSQAGLTTHPFQASFAFLGRYAPIRSLLSVVRC